MGKGGSRQNSQEITMINHSDLNQENDSGSGKKKSDLGYVSNSGADRIFLEIRDGCERKKF